MGATDPMPIDRGLLKRLREAGTRIVWRDAPRGAGPRVARIARLADEQARVEAVDGPAGAALRVESGPVGALVLLLEADRRGTLPRLEAWEAGRDPAFPAGALVAHWESAPAGAGPSTQGPEPPRLADLVELARYALP
jgi:hypothetical protein